MHGCLDIPEDQMPYRVTPTVVLLAASALLSGGSLPVPQAPNSAQLIVHEWGTFTSIAGEDGSAVQWVPRQAPAELPCFVDRLPLGLKGYLPGTVRMETPVLYFYAPAPTRVDVDVRFRQGVLTEWYPKARVTPAALDLSAYRRPDFEASLSWSGVTVAPGGDSSFLTEPGQSHYYQARDTDAAPLRVGSQTERFLFYRGVGLFAPPIRTTLDNDGRVSITAPAGGPIGDVVIVENHGGQVSYRLTHATTNLATLELPDLDDESGTPAKALEDLLVNHGLYRKEAAAMVNTWRDSWFEEGTRVFYLMPQARVDEILPLAIGPAPTSVVRVFVGRLELVTPAAMQDVEQALMANNTQALRKYGRFLQPIADRLLARADERHRTVLEERLRDSFSTLWSSSGGTECR
jgi:hypothetical protein